MIKKFNRIKEKGERLNNSRREADGATNQSKRKNLSVKKSLKNGQAENFAGKDTFTLTASTFVREQLSRY